MFRQAVMFFCLFIVVTEAGTFAGQLAGTLTSSRIFPANTEITQFQADGTLKRFTHGNGRLIVTRRGSYYIYAQAFFESFPQGDFLHNRVALTINGNEVSLMQTPLGEGRTDYGSHFTGVIKFLKKGDYISLKTVYPSRLWVSYAHTFFGAHKI